MTLRLQPFAFVCLVAAALLSTGCQNDGPQLGEVSGTVTLDGKPLQGAKVEFQPITPADGSPSYSVNRTDAEGKYKLMFSGDRLGAMVGEHQVRVTTFAQISTEDGGGTVEEKVPEKYNTQSELTKTVEAGENVIDLKLTST